MKLAVRKTLANQTTAWNKGNLDEFMSGYWKSDSLMFIGKAGLTYGWQTTLDNYKKGYPDTTAMGKLDFEIIEVRRLSVCTFLLWANGTWHERSAICGELLPYCLKR